MMQANTGVRFETKDPLLSQLVKQAEEKCRLNIKNFGGDPVLVEGGGYEKIWLETQPMGGAMYASRDFATGLNNSLMFMRHQRADGRIPGSIAVIDGKVVPQFNKFQGFCFPEPALDLYYLGGKDAEYLAQLAKTLEAFDAYLWRVRDSDGDGCLETWCKYDTGEDHAMRYADAPDPWEEETPPQGCTAVPIASMDVMSYSYACRETLAEIARISGDAEAQAQWAAKAKAVQDKMVSYLWDDARGAMFDRDKNHNQMPTLIHNTLRCMYWHSLPDALAERFVKEHLLNPQEFWTKMPLPSVAANDPLFRNVTTNNWSGQAEALTYQRAIRALENYGMYELIPQLGQKLMQAIGPQCRFVQQYDPFTGEPSVICEPGQPPQDAYGPAMLSVLEYTARMYGVSLVRDTVVWGTCPLECRYTQALNGRSWEIVNSVWISSINGGHRPYQSHSGGEKVKIALAVTLGLADVKAHRAGVQIGMLHIDEPPFLDAAGTEAYADALLNMAQRNPNMRILAISHDPTMKARFPQTITVEAGENGSTAYME